MAEGRYRFLMDDSGHWYCVPEHKVARFHELLNAGKFDQLDETFGDMRLGRPLKWYTFTDPRDSGVGY